jgi:hypothetical protein
MNNFDARLALLEIWREDPPQNIPAPPRKNIKGKKK